MMAALLWHGAMFRTPNLAMMSIEAIVRGLDVLQYKCGLLATTAKHGPARTGLQDMSNGPQHKL